MEDFLFVLGSNWQLSIAELDNVLKNSQYRGKIKDYSANVAIVEFENLDKNETNIKQLEELQFLLGGCQKIAKIYNFIHNSTIINAFPVKVEKIDLINQARNNIAKVLEAVIQAVFPKIDKKRYFYAVSIYPNFYDDEYYSVLIQHALPFLSKGILSILIQKGAKKSSSYYKYPEENIKSGKLNPIFPHHVIDYNLLTESRAEFIFGFTEEGMYIARTFTVDNPNFKKKIDEERPFKDFKSSISPKLALILLNFLNLFEKREEKKILDPFIGNGTIALFAILQDFQIFGADVDETKVKNTIRNINWLLKDIEEPIPPFLTERFKAVDIEHISDFFSHSSFDGACTEPFLGPYYTDKPLYTQAKELIDNDLEPLFNDIFRETYKLLKNKARICITAPIISTINDKNEDKIDGTIEGKNLQLDVNKIALKYKFKPLLFLDSNRIINKSNKRLQFNEKHFKNLIDAKKGQILKRKIYLFEKQE
ncbi:MAG TPA: hypothetical protein VGB37_11120 [Candidatus Lokiarchaeia archaeon]